MKFLCVGYLDHQKMGALSREQVDAIMAECPPLMEEFYRSGKVSLVAGTVPEAKGLRRVDGTVQVTDGPPAEAREAIGCVFLVEAADLTEALRVAALHPTTRLAAGQHLGFRIGISPVHYFEERRPGSEA